MIITAIRTVIIYIFIIAAIRIMGKRQLGELQPAELVVTLLISDLAAVPMQEVGMPLLDGLIPILVLVAMELLFLRPDAEGSVFLPSHQRTTDGGHQQRQAGPTGTSAYAGHHRRHDGNPAGTERSISSRSNTPLRRPTAKSASCSSRNIGRPPAVT